MSHLPAPSRRLSLLAVPLVALALVSLNSCGGEPEAHRATPEGRHRLQVVASTPPLASFARRIAGDAVDVTCPLPSADSEEVLRAIQKEPGLIERVQRADLILLNGSDFETWAAIVSLPVSAVVDTGAPLHDERIVIPNAIVHSHGPEGPHSHAGTDPYTWLDPKDAVRQAKVIEEALARRLPDESTRFESGYAALAKDLDGADATFARATKALDGRPLLVTHPTFAYLARHYGWNLVPAPLDPASAPSDEDLGRMRAAAASSGARLLLWAKPPRPEVEQGLREALRLTSVVIHDGLSSRPDRVEEDYAHVLAEDASAFAEAVAATR